jgi:hypothetical protein
MIQTDEDDEFDRIQHEIDMRAGQPYHYSSSTWKTLTDKELLTAYGWKDFEAETILQQHYREMVLGGLRGIETAIRNKNESKT